MKQLFIALVIIEGYDRYTILKLVAERIDCIVYNHYFLESPVGLKDP